MNTSIDVLAVMDQAIQREKDAGQPYVAQEAARAAVSDLIEASSPIDQEVPRLTGEQHARIRATLSRVKGEQP